MRATQAQVLDKYIGLDIQVEIKPQTRGNKRVLALTLHNYGRFWIATNFNAAAARNIASDALIWAAAQIRNPQQFAAVVLAVGEAVQHYVTPTPIPPPDIEESTAA
jgi:uncharacterized protein YjfI (DUF2170 family)